MKVFITRHGQTDENVKQVDIGHDSVAPLNQEGIKQAQKLGEFLKKEKIHYAYVSPQDRAVRTAKEILMLQPGVELFHAPELREQNLGIYESVPRHVWKEVKAKTKELFHLFKPERGESYQEVHERAKKFFHSLQKKHKDDTVLLVTHGGTAGMLILHLLDLPITEENYKKFKPDNTALTIAEILEDGSVKLHTINSLEHLGK